jgi:hypothetical protein
MRRRSNCVFHNMTLRFSIVKPAADAQRMDDSYDPATLRPGAR